MDDDVTMTSYLLSHDKSNICLLFESSLQATSSDGKPIYIKSMVLILWSVEHLQTQQLKDKGIVT